jgi:hypothetical protein
MQIMDRFQVFSMVCACAVSCGAAWGGTIVNGDFETGDASGWTVGGGYRGNLLNGALVPSSFLPGGANYNSSIANTHSAIVTPGTDPNTSNALNRVYSGNYSWRVEDTVSGGYASVLSQTVNNYSNSDFFFAWAAVLEGAHGSTDAATVIITLRDMTDNIDLITRQYNAATTGSGVDARFNFDNSTGFYWTPWQIEQLTLPGNAIGHDLSLTVLAADCNPTGHAGYLYLDGFGAAPPTTGGGVPEPSTYAMVGIGLALAIGDRIRRNRAK